MTNELIKTISKLTRNQALEAAGFVGQALASEPVDQKASALQAIAADPYRHLPDVESLARLVLICAAATEEGAKEVKNAISGIEKKQFILGGLEIVALAGLSVVALKVIVTRGRGRRRETLEFGEKDGNPYVKVENVEEPISITKDLAAILKGTLGIGGVSKPDAEE